MSHYKHWPSILVPAVLAGALCVAALTPGRLCGDAATTTQPAASQPTYASPEAVFKRSQEMAQAKDYGGFFDCGTEEHQIDASGVLAAVISISARASTQPGSALAIYEKYKLGELSENTAVGHPRGGYFPGNVHRLGAQIPNRRAFFVEALAWEEKEAGRKGEKSELQMGAHATLTDVKIDGDRAAGMLNMEGGHQPMKFKNVNGSWLVD